MNQLEELMQAQAEETPIELLTLNACQTAEGDDRAPLDLGGVALKAGVRSALGSLWMVSDQAAQTLIPAFYQPLQQPGPTKASALQQAQLCVLKQPDLAHPFFWVPFILMGNWL
jgi:CHAT domain-containing protein